MVMAVVLFAVVCFVRWQHPSVVSPLIRGLGLAAAAILSFGGYVGGKLVYQGGLGIEPTILKPDLRSKSAANSLPPAGPMGPVMPVQVGEAAGAEKCEHRAPLCLTTEPGSPPRHPVHRRHRHSAWSSLTEARGLLKGR